MCLVFHWTHVYSRWKILASSRLTMWWGLMSCLMQWAHFPHIHFAKQAKLDHQGEGTEKTMNGFYWWYIYKNGSLWVWACFFYAWPNQWNMRLIVQLDGLARSCKLTLASHQCLILYVLSLFWNDCYSGDCIYYVELELLSKQHVPSIIILPLFYGNLYS